MANRIAVFFLRRCADCCSIVTPRTNDWTVNMLIYQNRMKFKFCKVRSSQSIYTVVPWQFLVGQILSRDTSHFQILVSGCVNIDFKITITVLYATKMNSCDIGGWKFEIIFIRPFGQTVYCGLYYFLSTCDIGTCGEYNEIVGRQLVERPYL